jgi:large subunit ribosomal protein L18
MAKKSRSSMMTPRKRSRLRIRSKISGTTERPRISVFRSSKHIYAQLVVDGERRTVAAASTLDEEVLGRLKGAVTESVNPVSCKSVAAARVVGLVLAERCKSAGFERVVFDRNGFEYWGRIRALAEGAREAGLIF